MTQNHTLPEVEYSTVAYLIMHVLLLCDMDGTSGRGTMMLRMDDYLTVFIPTPRT